MRRSRIARNIKLGVKSLLLHKLRSLLTMLGVVFGVASVIAMLAIGEGSKRQALAEIEKLGTNNIIVSSRKPALDTGAGSEQRGSRTLVYGLTYDDWRRVRETVPGVRRVVPVRKLNKQAEFADRRFDIKLVGTSHEWFDLVQREVIAGRVLTPRDDAALAPSIVLTEHLARRLLVATHTVGQTIVIDGRVFTVVGIVRSEGRVGEAGSTLDAEADAFIPLSTCRAFYGEMIMERGAGSFTREDVDLHQFIVEMADRSLVMPASNVVRHMLERFHEADDYDLRVPLELLRRAAEFQQVFNMMLGAIAGISLLVGGIGIMNIMLASVTERTREIGIRRAIGAKRAQIISQFVTESLLLSVTGGLIGLVLGSWALPATIEQISERMGHTIETIVPLYSIVLSLGISVAVGVGFGLYPAIRAAKLDPIIALRHE